MKKLTDAQRRLLQALADGPAEAAGYQGKTHQPGGGAARAPMWTGKVANPLRPVYVSGSYAGGRLRYRITEAGRKALQEGWILP